MANIQIGKYKRPGIFIEEFNTPIQSSPAVEGLSNLVIGSSKKGAFNTRIRLDSIADLEAIYGPLDRQLERKGSFFHRTISKMLEISPVYAVNLLITDDNLDKIEFQSLSASAGFDNDVLREGAYRRFFDTTGFWKRDTEAFINLSKGNPGYADRAFNLTNISDRPISAFVFKTSLSGFDRTLIEWYGSVEKMPEYVNSKDYASDYMVDVVVVGGDWSNYQELSVDPRWSAYFNASGLRKEKVRDFANDRNVSSLAFYEGLSLIPYFRDLEGRNIFIETAINRDTDKTGLFCAFNNDLVEQDFYNGKLDLIGNTIVGENETEINFLSYKELIAEEISISNKPLDLPGNVVSLGFTTDAHAYGATPKTSGVIANSNRTGWFAEGTVYGLNAGSLSVTPSATEIEFTFTATADAYAVVNGIDFELTTTTIELTNTDFADGAYKIVFYINNSGEIVYKTELANFPSVSSSDIVLGHSEFTVISDVFDTTALVYTPICVNVSGFVPLTTTDFTITSAAGVTKVEFTGTGVAITTSQYDLYRRLKAFNLLISLLDSPNKDNMAISFAIGEKTSLENVTISDIVTETSSVKSFTLNNLTAPTTAPTYLNLYLNDDELLLGKDGVSTDTSLLTGFGSVAKNSVLYRRFYDGIINTGDYFYTNRLYKTVSTADEPIDVTFYNDSGVNYIIFEKDLVLAIGDQLLVPSSNLNKTKVTITSVANTSLANYNGKFAYEVSEEVRYEDLFNVDMIYDFKEKIYLQMYIDNDGFLKVTFMDEGLLAPNPIEIASNNRIVVQSAKSNLKQSVEIEEPVGYTRVSNKILVKGDRYTEVRPGDFLEAEALNGSLRKLTRILSKRTYINDSSLVEITCDSAIATVNFNGDLQTMRYMSVDRYADTYKALTFKGFKLREDSLPDGTELKQNKILNLVAKGTPLFKALTNKESFDFRYLIDSYGLGLTERSKQQLVDICGERLDAFGFINMPSLKSFKNSSSPSFVDNEGVLKIEYVAQGGDSESNPAFLYSFGDGQGATSVGYFTPYVTVNDNGRPLDMPPASYVATTYMKKHISNITSITPWTICAGVTNGKVSNIAGLEMEFDPEDIEFLNLAQMNPIVFKRRRGHVIETQNTAETLYKSSLSYINSREVLIELERELSTMLLDYQWKFNTPDVRAEIKLRADVICETFVSKNGIYNYFNKMDDENNTNELIDNQIGVLDTYIEITKGMSIIVNNITILRTGAISMGGFINS